MSESESFIQEVTEEVRRDRLYQMARRYGWIPVVVILAIVGGAAWNEWRKSRERSEAQAFGDALIAALNSPEETARDRALSGTLGSEEAAPFLALMRAADKTGSEDLEAASEMLQEIAGNTEIDRSYSDLAALKLVLLGDDGVDANTRAQLLDRLSAAGAPYRILALEQQAIALAAEGEVDAARVAAENVLREPGLTQPIVQRIGQLLVILGTADDSAAEDG